MKYVAPHWLPGGQLQTIWPALYARRALGPRPEYRRERWDTPDGDFVDVDFLKDGIDARVPRPLLVVRRRACLLWIPRPDRFSTGSQTGSINRPAKCGLFCLSHFAT